MRRRLYMKPKPTDTLDIFKVIASPGSMGWVGLFLATVKIAPYLPGYFLWNYPRQEPHDHPKPHSAPSSACQELMKATSGPHRLWGVSIRTYRTDDNWKEIVICEGDERHSGTIWKSVDVAWSIYKLAWGHQGNSECDPHDVAAIGAGSWKGEFATRWAFLGTYLNVTRHHELRYAGPENPSA
ncbi:hypothetical protein EDB19DRAFT_1836016 [Suillus lakei]|nr:hypothetical protein EDB19DRAFT_1836016 [Suillus lakei]